MSRNVDNVHTGNLKKYKKRVIICIIVIILAAIFCISLFKINEIQQIAKRLLAEPETETQQDVDTQSELINLDVQVKNETEESYECLLTFTSNDENNKIKQVEYPTQEVITVADEEGKEKVAIDYEIIKKDEDKTFNITTTDGKTYAKRTGYKITYKNGDEIFKVESRLLTQTIPITNTSPIKEGKHFIGYSEDKESTISDYFENGLAKVDKDTTLYAIYTEQKNGYTESIENESLIGKVSKINASGLQEITVNGETYSANVIVENNDLVLDGEKQVQGSTLVDKVYEFGNSSQDVAKEEGLNEDGTTKIVDAQNMVILKVNGNLTINSNVTLTACKSANGYGGPKGLFIYATGTISNNGTIDMTARGARAEGQDVYLWKNGVYKDESKKYEYVPALGEDGGESENGQTHGEKGDDSTESSARTTGGGGAGLRSTRYSYTYAKPGAGSSGTSYSGGTGGGGAAANGGPSTSAEDGMSNGGKGGNGSAVADGNGWVHGYDAGGGAGNPGGFGSYKYLQSDTRKGENGTGGLLIINSEKFYNSGNIHSNGSGGGLGNAKGGSSGGGSINIFYSKKYNNNGKYKVNGGENNGGRVGGNGSVTIGNISSGTFIEGTGSSVDTSFDENTFTLETNESDAKNTDKYGWKVPEYTVKTEEFTTGVWRLFYQDSNYTYLITDECVGSYKPSDYYTTMTNEKGELKYQTGADVSTVGQKLNSIINSLFTSSNTNENIRSTAWLTDTSDSGMWSGYKNTDAVFAIGSPTAELFAASYNNRSNKSNMITLSLRNYGYIENPAGDYLSADENDNYGIYYKDDLWLSSPGDGDRKRHWVHREVV